MTWLDPKKQTQLQSERKDWESNEVAAFLKKR